jgi:hypothetical protein
MLIRPPEIATAAPGPDFRKRHGRLRNLPKRDLLTIRAGDGHLKAFLECGDGTRGLREGGNEMAQGHGVDIAVDFARWIGYKAQTRTDMTGKNTPSGKPAAGSAQRKDQSRSLPRGVGGSSGRMSFKKFEKLPGSQRAVGNDVMPIDGKCTSTAYF